MSPQFQIARHRIHLARTTIDEADVLIAARRWRGALNRLYYAAFYAARALLATRDLDSARHSGVITLFQQHFVKTGVIQDSTARTLPRSFQLRQTSDYADTTEPTAEQVQALRTEVADFIGECERVVQELAAAEGADG